MKTQGQTLVGGYSRLHVWKRERERERESEREREFSFSLSLTLSLSLFLSLFFSFFVSFSLRQRDRETERESAHARGHLFRVRIFQISRFVIVNERVRHVLIKECVRSRWESARALGYLFQVRIFQISRTALAEIACTSAKWLLIVPMSWPLDFRLARKMSTTVASSKFVRFRC